MRTRWPRYRIASAATDYDELYVGLAGRRLSTYLYVSPGSRDNPLAYGQVAGALPVGPDWWITGHAGLSVLPARMTGRTAYDIGIGLVRRVGAVDYRIGWSAAEPYRRTRARSPVDHAVVLGVAYSF